jgi:hypothetical protein
VRRREALRHRFLAAGAAAGLAAAGFALAGETGAAPGDTTGTSLTLPGITSVTATLPTSATKSLPTTAVTTTRPLKPKHPSRKHRRKRTVSTATAATTASPPSPTGAATTAARLQRRATTVPAPASESKALPRWAIGGFAVAGLLIATGLGGLYVTRIRGR